MRAWVRLDGGKRRRDAWDLAPASIARSLGNGLHEVRTGLPGNRIARFCFYVDRKQRMVLLHGFIKKTQRTAAEDLELARRNKSKRERSMK